MGRKVVQSPSCTPLAGPVSFCSCGGRSWCELSLGLDHGMRYRCRARCPQQSAPWVDGLLSDSTSPAFATVVLSSRLDQPTTTFVTTTQRCNTIGSIVR